MASPSSSPEVSAAGGGETNSFSYKNATQDEVLEDLTARFILNLPDEELTSLERILFQVEQAHWYYEDFIRPDNPRYPGLPLRKFTAMMFAACPVLQHWNHEEAFDTFMRYKTQVPVCGAIMLNETWDKCVLVKGWKSSSGWGFPKGKINQVEEKSLCAIREVLEETGYNLAGKINPEHYIETVNNGQLVTLYIVPGVSEDYPFRTKTRKEISKIEWFRLIDLPTWRRSKQTPGKFYLISPFIAQLKAFVNTNKPRKPSRRIPSNSKAPSNVANAPQTPARMPESDALQDSSSQSSSLDNGDPQTPSPQYSEAIPAVVPRIAGEQGPLFATEALDPHFARLLSGLTISAANAPEEVLNDSKHVADSNLAKPATNPTVASELAPSKVVSKADTPVSQFRSAPFCSTEISSNPTPVSPPKHPLTADSQQKESRLSPPGPATTTKSPIPSTLSPRSPALRKSSVADISPYLSRPTEVPVSARRLQQLALLESVADESARMTPLLNNRSPLLHTIPPHPPILPLPYQPGGPNTLYSSTQAAGYPAPFNYSGHLTNPMGSYDRQDPFLGRSRTSQAFHRAPYHSPPGSLSMNQNQLLSLINGARGAPAPSSISPNRATFPQPSHQPPANFSQTHPNPPLPLGQPLAGPVPQHARYPHPAAHQFASHRPFSAAHASPLLATQVPVKPHNQPTNALLTILNSNPSSVYPAPPGPHFTPA